MRITVLIFVLLLGIHAFASGYVHSNVTYVLQPGEIRNFYLPEQTGSISFHLLEAGGPVSYGAAPRGTIEGETLQNGAYPTSFYASTYSVTNDWYPNIYNQNDTAPVSVTFAIEVHEPITAVGRTINLLLAPYALQYVRIPAEADHGLSFSFDIECDYGGSDYIAFYLKSASGSYFTGGYARQTLWENEELMLIVSNDVNEQRNCTLSIVSKPTVVLTNGLNILTINSSTPTIGTRYVPTSPRNNMVYLQLSSKTPIYRDSNQLASYYEGYYIMDGQHPVNFLFDTSSVLDSELNVTVTPITTVLLNNGVKQTFQCTNGGDRHVFALLGDDKKGRVAQVIQMEGVDMVYGFYVIEGRSLLNGLNTVFAAPYALYAESNNVVWLFDAVCSQSDTTGSITVSLPEFKTLSIGKNVLNIGTAEDSFYVLPQGPDQTVLSVHVNSSNANGWYFADNYYNYDWDLRTDLKTEIVYARDSSVVSPAWYFTFYHLDVAESMELTLTAIPIDTLKSGETRQFIKPDFSYGLYWNVVKMEADNGLGHALTYNYDFHPESAEDLRITVNSLYDNRSSKKRNNYDGSYISEHGNATYYIAIRTTEVDSPLNFTATFAPVTMAMDGVADFSRTAQPEEQVDSFHTFMFPARKKHNALFKFDFSSSTSVEAGGIEGTFAQWSNTEIPNYYLSLYTPDSQDYYIITETASGQSTSVHLESVATIGLCNSQYDCNGHGSCASMADQCTCTDGYSGDWCDVPPSPPTPSDDNNNSGAGQIMIITYQLLVLFATLMLAF